jgi:hypothetical protein
MTRQVSKPNIFWAPSLETARKIDDEDTVQSIETARYRFAASMADLVLRRGSQQAARGFCRGSGAALPGGGGRSRIEEILPRKDCANSSITNPKLAWLHRG